MTDTARVRKICSELRDDLTEIGASEKEAEEAIRPILDWADVQDARLELNRSEVEALHFHYTKDGIPESQTAARELAAKMEAFLSDAPQYSR